MMQYKRMKSEMLSASFCNMHGSATPAYALSIFCLAGLTKMQASRFSEHRQKWRFSTFRWYYAKMTSTESSHPHRCEFRRPRQSDGFDEVYPCSNFFGPSDRTFFSYGKPLKTHAAAPRFLLGRQVEYVIVRSTIVKGEHRTTPLLHFWRLCHIFCSHSSVSCPLAHKFDGSLVCIPAYALSQSTIFGMFCLKSYRAILLIMPPIALCDSIPVRLYRMYAEGGCFSLSRTLRVLREPPVFLAERAAFQMNPALVWKPSMELSFGRISRFFPDDRRA
eukprot:284815066_6